MAHEGPGWSVHSPSASGLRGGRPGASSPATGKSSVYIGHWDRDTTAHTRQQSPLSMDDIFASHPGRAGASTDEFLGEYRPALSPGKSDDGFVRIYETQTGKLVAENLVTSAVGGAAVLQSSWSPDGAMLASACSDGVLRLLDRNANVRYESEEHINPITRKRTSLQVVEHCHKRVRTVTQRHIGPKTTAEDQLWLHQLP